MMYKSNSKAGRRWAVLAAIPAAVAAFAVINVPAFAEVLSETEGAAIPIPSGRKVTKNIADVKIPLQDAVEDVIAESAAESAEQKSATKANENVEDKSKVKENKEKKTEQNLEIDVNGKKITSEQMHALNPSDIESMKIEKNKDGNPGIIRITLKDGKTLDNAIKNPSQAKKQSSESDEVYVTVEKSAEYRGGQKALMEYLAANVKYPEEAVKKDIQGRVIVKFVVTKSGKIKDATVLKGVDPLLDKEAVRVVESMPDWEPAEIKGVAVDSYFHLPVIFKLHKQESKPEAKADTIAK